MKKNDWFLVIAIVFIVWGIDYFSKQWALANIRGLEFYGPFGLVLHRNPGAILGTFSDLPPVLRIVSLSTGGAFLIFLYASLQYLLPRRFMMLRLGMSILLGGILGNVTDRIIEGSVVDFLLLGSPKMATPAFNFSDAIQWVGYGLIVIALVKDGHKLWPTKDDRKRIWINPAFQIKYTFKLMFIGFGFALISGVFSYTYLAVTIDELVPQASGLYHARFVKPFLITYAVIALAFIFSMFLLGRILSHRTAGPLYAFEKFLEDTLDGKSRQLRLRAGDEFKHLEELAEKIQYRFAGEFQKKQSELPPKD